jgi:GNAT superfamily N-acetyltransferase
LPSARVAAAADAADVTETFALAFSDDPVWTWAFPDEGSRLGKLREFWGLLVRGAMPHGWIWLTEGCGAATLWIPPGEPDLVGPEADRYSPMLMELAGERSEEVALLSARFKAARPTEPHYFLSLLGTLPSHRGRGEGMWLLEENLAAIDEEGGAAYLESTNSANDHRYEARGFERFGEFSLPDGPVVGRMWRDARTPAA